MRGGRQSPRGGGAGARPVNRRGAERAAACGEPSGRDATVVGVTSTSHDVTVLDRAPRISRHRRINGRNPEHDRSRRNSNSVGARPSAAARPASDDGSFPPGIRYGILTALLLTLPIQLAVGASSDSIHGSIAIGIADLLFALYLALSIDRIRIPRGRAVGLALAVPGRTAGECRDRRSVRQLHARQQVPRAFVLFALYLVIVDASHAVKQMRRILALLVAGLMMITLPAIVMSAAHLPASGIFAFIDPSGPT